MAGYFSFRKLISTPLVKIVYFLGFIALTSAGIALAGWAGMRLNEATIPKRLGIYYIAAGVGAVIVGNVAWRMVSEFWIVLFNIHSRLVSIDRAVNQSSVQAETKHEEFSAEMSEDKVEAERKGVIEELKREGYDAARPASVLGLS